MLYKFSVGVLLAFLLAGCASKMTMRALEPAEIDRAASLKQIGVLEFNERKVKQIHLADKLEAMLATKQLDGENYFVVVSRSDLDRLVSEQKLQRSGLFDERKTAEIGRLTGAQALISGSVSSTSSHDSRHREERQSTRCDSKGKNCQPYTYYVHCTVRSIGIGAQIRMIDVQRGDLVTAQSYNEVQEWKKCDDHEAPLMSESQGLEILSNTIAADFVKKITPRYITFEVTLIDKLDVKLPEHQEEKFKAALAFLKEGRLDRSERLLSELLEETQQQSYAVAYNLGVIKEAQASYKNARTLYHLADNLTVKPVAEINNAMQRIDAAMAKHQRAQEQIKR